MKKVIFLLLIALPLLFSACQSDEKRIMKAIDDASYCTADSDCVLVQSQCPFDCYAAVNKAEAENIEKLIFGYESRCVYGCIQCDTAICHSGKCRLGCL